MTDQLPGMPQGLTAEETEYVYYVEVVGLPPRKAANCARFEYRRINEPHIMQARAQVRRHVRGDLNVTKEDVTFGIKEAIERARILGEPMTEIAGWDRLIKLHGLDAPQRIDINVRASVEAYKEHVRRLSDDELMADVGAGNVIDADFYEVDRPA